MNLYSYAGNACDYLGRRVKKTIHETQTTIHYAYDGDQVIAEYEGDTLVRKFINGPGIDEPIMMIVVSGETETDYYYHFDGLGSVVALSDGRWENVPESERPFPKGWFGLN